MTFRTFLPLTLACAAASAVLPAHADTLAQWNFNDGDLLADVGAGNIGFVGGTATSGFNSGSGSSDPVQPGVGWSISSFALQGTEDKGRGASFSVSTLGFENLVFSYDMRHSGTASGWEAVQYAVDGGSFVDLALFQTTDTFFANGRTVDLSGLADDAAAVTIRVVATFAPGTSAYVPTSSASYGTTGTMRFDMVTFSADPIAAIPEPGTYALLMAGLAAVGAAARRRRG